MKVAQHLFFLHESACHYVATHATKGVVLACLSFMPFTLPALMECVRLTLGGPSTNGLKLDSNITDWILYLQIAFVLPDAISMLRNPWMKMDSVTHHVASLLFVTVTLGSHSVTATPLLRVGSLYGGFCVFTWFVNILLTWRYVWPDGLKYSARIAGVLYSLIMILLVGVLSVDLLEHSALTQLYVAARTILSSSLQQSHAWDVMDATEWSVASWSQLPSMKHSVDTAVACIMVCAFAWTDKRMAHYLLQQDL
jgi:hypothetical protein